MDWKNLWERAAWTFVEAFLVALPSTLTLDLPAAGWVSTLLAAACAGLSALKTLLVEAVHKRLEAMEEEEAADIDDAAADTDDAAADTDEAAADMDEAGADVDDEAAADTDDPMEPEA